MTQLSTAANAESVPAHGVSFAEALRVWTRVALLSFGGPTAQIAVMHRIIVDEKHWISESRFLYALNYCMLLPGPEAKQLAVYIGWLMHRTLGGIVAGSLFVVPGIISIMALSYVYAIYGKVPVVVALFFGLKAAVLAIVVEAVVRIGKRALKNNALRLLAAAAFIGIFFFNIPFPVIILGAAAIGYLGTASGAEVFKSDGGHGKGADKYGEDKSLLGDELPEHARPSVARASLVSAVWLALWLIPVIALLATLGNQNVFSNIASVLQQNGHRHLRRGLCGAGLRRAGSGRAIWLAQARRNAGWTGHGRDNAGSAHHGSAVRGFHGCVPRSRIVIAVGCGDLGRTVGNMGHLHSMLSLDFPWRTVCRNVTRQQGPQRRTIRDYRCGRGRSSQFGGMVCSP